jgi:2-keto-3-deoxy-L-fuconate dehydrogenase
MTGRLTGKRCLITAAGAGIGRASALAFAHEGASVLATDLDADALATLGECIATAQLDVTSGSAIASLIAAQDGFDVLFNCAGWVPSGSILDCTPGDWQRACDINVTSMYRMTRAVLPGMLARGGGSIVNMASAASSIHGVPNRFAYATTKAAVIGLTKSVAADFVADNIRVNAICPGTIDTPSLAQRIAANQDAAAARAAFIARQPMGRLGRAEEVAALAVYLASDESSFTTGAVHVIDGGWTM